MTAEHVTDILGDLTAERHVEEGEGGALGGSETGADTTEEETSGLITSLLFLETLANLPQLLPDESETSTKQPTDGTGPDNRRPGGQTDLGKRTHTAKSNSQSQGGKKGKKKSQTFRYQESEDRRTGPTTYRLMGINRCVTSGRLLLNA